MISRLLKNPISQHTKLFSNPTWQNIVTKRWSGHNAMTIEPSNYQWKKFKDTCHFYFLMASIPTTILMSIIGIRSNPELTEVPEGYEPRHWEYYKHPLSRWTAKYLFRTVEVEHEMAIALCEDESENMMLRKVARNADKVMKFYNDHRSEYFRPFYAELFRSGREQKEYGVYQTIAFEGHDYEAAYDPNVNPVPTEGYVPSSID